MGKSWIGGLIFSIVVSTIFGQIFSFTIGLGPWIGFAMFLACFFLFLWITMRSGHKRRYGVVSESAELKQLQAYDLKDEEDSSY